MASNVEPNGGGFKYLRRYLLRGGMRGLDDSTQHELKVLGEQVVHTGGLPPAGRGKPTVENGTALRPRDKLLAGHAVDLRRWRVLWLPRAQHLKP